jgi:hypothetical protein
VVLGIEGKFIAPAPGREVIDLLSTPLDILGGDMKAPKVEVL